MSIQHTNRNAHIARMERQRELRRPDLETVDSLLVGRPSLPEDALFKSDHGARKFVSVDELVLAGNQKFDDLNLIDFAGFRNDQELGRKVLQETREHVATFHPEGAGKAFNEDVRRVINARYVQGHGMQVEAHLDGDELASLRKYVQAQAGSPDVADAVGAINRSLSEGQDNVNCLISDAERSLFAERGVDAATFGAAFSKLDASTMQKARNFADSWANSESGKFLSVAKGGDFDALRQSMAHSMLAARGYQGVEGVDIDTALSLLRDVDAEGPRTNATIATAVNEALSGGETNYFKLSTRGNEAILLELGMTKGQLKGMKVTNAALKEAFPDDDPNEVRAIRTRVLRDLLRVLPDGERAAALQKLSEGEADLLTAEKILSKHLGGRIREFGKDSVAYQEMGAMQRANLASALSKLPQELRESVFTGEPEKAPKRLEKAIEKQFGIDVHHKTGVAPRGKDSDYAPYVQKMPLQALADLYNALSSMSKGGDLPPGLSGTTTVSFMAGAPTAPSMTPLSLREESDPVGPYDRPGGYAYTEGKSGYFGECDQDEKGNDGVILFDDALYGGNGDGAVGLTLSEGTWIHELSHAVQLGGTPDRPEEQRKLEVRKNIAEWSSLSGWSEPDRQLADGVQGEYGYYYDPGVRVANRKEVSTSYGASDPVEDFAEFSPFFFKDPETAMALSAEKFLYFNRFVGDFYAPEQVAQVAARVGVPSEALSAAQKTMASKVAAAPQEAGILLG